MTDFLSTHWLDIVTTILGLIYLVLEYRASIALWVVGIVMPAMDIYLYWSHGLYGDAGMAVYYTLAAIYGYAVWKFGAKWKAMIKRKGSDKKEGASAVSPDKIEAANAVSSDTTEGASAVSSSSEELPITFFPRRLILRTLVFFRPCLGCHILCLGGLHQQYGSLARCLHQRSELRRLMGIGTQVC